MKKNKIRWLTRTALLLALLIGVQWVTKPLGQYVTGTLVNCVLAVAALNLGLASGLTIGLVSPVMAFLLAIAPQLVVVPAIMAGNCTFVLLLHFLIREKKEDIWERAMGLCLAALGKFLVLYLLVTKVICGLCAELLMGQVAFGKPLLLPPMLKMLPTMFSVPQLVTALLGGSLALTIYPFLRKTLK